MIIFGWLIVWWVISVVTGKYLESVNLWFPNIMGYVWILFSFILFWVGLFIAVKIAEGIED